MLDDLSRQGFRDFEVIVADENFNGEAKFDKHFKPRPKAEGDAWNLNKAYNDAIAKAEGELLVFLQDFIWIPDTGLQRFWDDYQQYPNALVTGAGHKAQGGLEGISERDIRIGMFSSFEECPFHCWEMNWASAPKDLFPPFDERMDSYYGGENHFVAKLAQKFGAIIMIDPLNRCIGYSQEHCGGRPADWEIRHASKQGRLDEFLESIDQLERW